MHALPDRAKDYEIRFPRVEGYSQAVRNRATIRDWDAVPSVRLEPGRIPPEVEVKALLTTNEGRMSLSGPGRLEGIGLEQYRNGRRLQALVFDVAQALTREMAEQGACQIPPHALFPQLARLTERYVEQKVTVIPPSDRKDLFLAPYYGWLVETLRASITGDEAAGDTPELPLIEGSRGPGSTRDVDFWTSREVREVVRSHVNYVVADTARWEQSAAYYLDTDPAVASFVKNAGLGLGIPYLHDGQQHEYLPDFVVRLAGAAERYLLLETKGYDPLKETKVAAARRWCAAVNHAGSYGSWAYAIVEAPERVPAALRAAAAND